MTSSKNGHIKPILRAGGVVSGESSVSKETVQPATLKKPARRFEHYELVKGEDGKPVELWRGAMGVTYKAFDVDLQCPVTLKVISERYLGDDSARLRFLREARAAASVRHPNVASVFHLGRTAASYFYAMEFVGLTDWNSTEWQTILAKLRRATLLAREDPHNPGSRHYAMRGLQIWRSEHALVSPVEEPITPVTSCLCYVALSEWHLGEIASCEAAIAETIALAKELNDMHALAQALFHVALLDDIELSTRQNIATWLPAAVLIRGWARSASGDLAEGISRIEDGLKDNRASRFR
jgi:hypothetical protein